MRPKNSNQKCKTLYLCQMWSNNNRRISALQTKPIKTKIGKTIKMMKSNQSIRGEKMSTKDNLKAAFAGESQANRRYLAFAKKADQEGLKQVAKLFRAAADAEIVHASNHLNVLKAVKTTAENLQEAINGETHEFNEMYPKMIEEAEQEGNQQAKISFHGANAVEKVHANLYKKALESVKAGNDLEEKEIHVCQVCGYTVEGEAPDECPICKSKKDKFKKID